MSTAVGNVLLNISTGKTDFASIKGFVDLMGQAIRVVGDFAKKNDAYVDAMQKMSVSVDKAVQATGSLIETQKLMATTAKLSMAGVKFTEDQFRNLAVAAADMGEITGDAAGALDALTTAVISGNERGLKPYGISLEGATTRTEKQAKALEELNKKFKDVTVEADTLTDGFVALGNAGADLIGALWSAQYDSKTGFLGWLNDVTREASRTAAAIRNVGISHGIAIGQVEKAAKGGVGSGLALGLGALFGWGSGNLGAEEQSAKDANAKEAEERAAIQAARALDDAMDGNIALAAERDAARNSARLQKLIGGGKGGSAKSSAQALSPYDANRLGIGTPPPPAYASSSTAEQDIFMASGQGELPIESGFSQVITQEMQLMEKRKVMGYEWMDYLWEMEDAELSFADSFADSWKKHFKQINLGASVATGMFEALEGSIRMVAEAAIEGQKLSSEAFFNMVSKIALNIGVKATLEALYEGFQAARCTASYNYPEAALHTAAAVTGAITAAAAFAIAAGSRAIGNGAGSSPNQSAGFAAGGGATGYTGPSVPGKQSDSGSQTVVVVLEGDAEGVFRVSKKGSRLARANGETGFAEAS